MKRCKQRKLKFPRVPLPRQTGGAHGPRNDKQVRVLRDRANDRD